jgi:transposase
METEGHATSFLETWIKEVNTKKIGPFMKSARTVASHKSGIINFVKSRINNRILEDINRRCCINQNSPKSLPIQEDFLAA